LVGNKLFRKLRLDLMINRIALMPALSRTLVPVLLVTLVLSLSTAAAQEPVGGRVRDTSGAAAPGVAIVVRDAAGQVLASATSDAAGRFSLPALAPGEYVVTATLDGFGVSRAALQAPLAAPVELVLRPAGLAEAVVVTGHALVGSEEVLRRTPGSYDVITREALDRARVFTSSEALRKLPGVTVRDEEGVGLRPNIGLRGLNPTRSSKVLLLEDGLPVTYAPYGDNSSYYHPPVERFDRIEILKGSSQIAYGPVTLGGVVNYITPEAPARTAVALDLTAGNRGYVNGGASAGGRRGAAGFFGHVTHKQADGSRENIATTLSDVLAKATLTVRDTQHLSVKGNYYREDSQVGYSGLREAEYQANPRQNPFANDSFDGQRVGASATYQALLWSRVAATVQAYGSTFSRDWWRQSSNSGQRPNDSGDPLCGGMANLHTTCGNEGRLRDYAHGGVETRARVLFGAGVTHELDFGARAHAEHQDRRQQNGATPVARAGALVEDNQRTTAGLSAFVQHRLSAGPWSVTPGVRLERISYSRTNRLAGVSGTTDLTEVVPGVGVAFGPSPNVTIFGGVHRGFAPPRAEDIISNSTGGSIALDPERSWNYEGGVRGRRGRLQGSLTAFRLDYANQIVPASLAGGVGAALTNGGQTLHQGLEAGAQAEWASLGGSRHGAYASAALTWLPVARFAGTRSSSVGGFTTQSVSGNRLPYAPEWSHTVTLGYRHAAGLDVQVESQHVGAQFGDDLNTVVPTADGQRGRLNAYTYWNLTASAPIARTAGRVFVAVKNLADRTFIVDRVRGILPGHPRLVHVGTTWRF
jgi:Fe(3+) dicitrate transport protein